ncbi:MAG: CDC27 family protein [Parabacteroides sp.]
MTLQEIDKSYRRIIGSLETKELKAAFDHLQGLMAGARDYAFQDKLDRLQETYQNMLRYRISGIKDPMEEAIYRDLQTSAYLLADQLRDRLFTRLSSLSYYNRKRNRKESQSMQMDAFHKAYLSNGREGSRLTEEQEKLIRQLFEEIWISGLLTADQTEGIKSMLHDRQLHVSVGCQLVSALLLGLQQQFDEAKLLLLLEAADTSVEEIRVRAMVVLLLILYRYRKRIALYPQIHHRLSALAESQPDFIPLLRDITLQFIMARETEKITRKLQDEIIPEMMKINPTLSQKLNLNDLLHDQTLGDEMNPEWKEQLTRGKLGKKMTELSELQLEGADVMHSTFTHLKSFPFFQEISHWFFPFTTEHPDLQMKESSDVHRLLDSITHSPLLCDSDKYSLCFSMLQMPQSFRNMMIEQYGANTSQLVQELKETPLSAERQRHFLLRQYVEDLYRFYKLYPEHLNFDDPFSYPLDFHNLPILQPYMSDRESLTTVAESYLKKNHFADALPIFVRLVECESDNALLYQKIGYCKQMDNDLAGALEAYKQSDLIQPNSKWVLRRMAACYRTLKQPEMALEYYRRYEKLNPDDLSIQISMGHCYLELKDYNEALRYFFKVDYLDSRSDKAWRPIAWCSFLTGKYDQARSYYKKILDRKPTAQDYLNAGHTEWVLQHLKEALHFYQQAVRAEEHDFRKFRELFDQDIPDLIAAGIEEEEIPLMLDQLHYVMDGSID